MRYQLALVILLVPVFTFAATLEAGFPSQTIWVSASSVTEGEMITISTVVYNGGLETFQGTLVFTADESRIGTREFELSGKESRVYSVEWKPHAGKYELAAHIEDTSEELSQKQTPSLTVTVAEPPKSPALQQAITQFAQNTAAIASSSAPFVRQTAQTIFAQTEALREAGVEQLEAYLASHATRTPDTQSVVAGSSTNTSRTTTTPNSSKGKELLSSIGQVAAAAALFTLKNSVLFYPILGPLILGILYALARGVRRPRD